MINGTLCCCIGIGGGLFTAAIGHLVAVLGTGSLAFLAKGTAVKLFVYNCLWTSGGEAASMGTYWLCIKLMSEGVPRPNKMARE
ncbi:hypothetical protein [Parashewanella tropica]|uniref:hypothetical protein n=1 Tax=Parashewanella tropica TaxID=2547970 RepID=UPI0014789305|nr:hypothetical protein [Parashewanella tropica]